MKKSNEILLILDEECSIEAHFVENEHIGMYGLFWDIDYINGVPENESDLTLELNINCLNLEINNWTQLENIEMKDDDNTIPIFYDIGNGDCFGVEEVELMIYERIEDSFRVKIKGLIDKDQLLHYSDNDIDKELLEMGQMRILIDSRMKFKGITILKEYIKDKDPEKFLSEFFQIGNLIITEKEDSFLFVPKI